MLNDYERNHTKAAVMARKKYKASVKGKISAKKYRESDKGQSSMRKNRELEDEEGKKRRIERGKVYSQTEAGRRVARSATKRMNEKYPEKLYARNKARIIPGEVCGISDCSEVGEKHHPDYSKPLDVEHLCRKHHTELHWNEKTIERCDS
jgi:hypothetical protein